MKSKRRWPALCLIGAGLALAAASGCQAYVPVPGLTLPSGHYLEHPPGYTPPSGPFPLPQELSRMQEGAPVGDRGAEALPPAIPPNGP